MTMEAASDPEGKLKERDGSNSLEVDNSKFEDSVTMEVANTGIVDHSEACN